MGASEPTANQTRKILNGRSEEVDRHSGASVPGALDRIFRIVAPTDEAGWAYGDREQSGIAIVLLSDRIRGPTHNVPLLWWLRPRSCGCRVGVGNAIPVTAAARRGQEGTSCPAYDRRRDARQRRLVRPDL